MRIGLFLKNLDEEYQISIYKGVRAEADSLDMDLVCVQGELLQHYLSSAAEPFPSREFIAADGILFLSSVILNPAELEFAPDLKTLFKNIPFVSIGTRLFDYPSILTKSRKSMGLLMEHLVFFHGYRKLLYIGGPVNHQDNIIREEVFRDFIETQKDRFPGLEGTIINGEFLEMSGMVIARDYISAHSDNPPDVIIAANDNTAIGIQGMLQSQTDPRWHDCPVTGFDDIDQARLEVPALTTVHQPLDVLGKLAVQTLRDIILGKKVPPIINTDSELIIRNSCGCKASEGFGENPFVPDIKLSSLQYQSIKSEYHLRNISLLGRSLVTVNSNKETLPPIQFFLTNLGVKTFYLILYPKPILHIGDKGNLVYQRTIGGDISYMEDPKPITLKIFFTDYINRDKRGPRTWCLYHLRSGSEHLGLIVYEASDTIHPQLCSAAIFMANTVKRLLIHDDEKERARNLEREVAFRTRDLLDTNKKLQDEAKRRIEVEAEVLRISEMERLRFSMDLHDDICQRLAGISMFCKSLAGEDSPQSLPELSKLIDETLRRTRRYAHDSFPMELDTLGLKNALDSLCRMFNTQTSCRCIYTWSAPELSPLSPAQDINVYRIIQEALQNAAKHSKATRVTVDIRLESGILTVTIRDNGIGNSLLEGENPVLDGNRRREGLGLRSMRYRAHQLGAEYLFKSSKGGGTLVEVRIPLGQ
jgi:signal transduction histidine kinase/DNA-binding LacI/PurR family transcriptional regulator